ncbi:TIGR01621 family pseudouridine synthase [Vibrio penaeicida]|uniref:RNA pseudouridine synthase n=1 Tax=Vibrio penaeicida TaxID=104609 RepID=A0AAV5NS85_9VIBR|nr:TIGR01621 family pseudouridine synthase [Vibrio penaeicida]RTZ22698.1 TIGR01621 family pseudouridine synthase [Vibrio penaeicida]GLQ73560.1 RNA pseudouridine synthase [Vibrio penaeicida]
MFDILYTHPDFLIINKHFGVSVHKDDGDVSLPIEVAKVSGDEQLYLVHRLDKMTSGMLILARHAKAANKLSSLFAQREIEKFYLAIGAKKPKKKQGTIVGDMERSRRSSWKLMSSKANPAITQFFSSAGEAGERVFLCKPYTGKTHQIRVALKSVGSPIIGDDIYHPSSVSDRGYLHAYALRFTYDDHLFEFLCNPAEHAHCGEKWQSPVIKEALEAWKTPWNLIWPTVKTK